jgi:hypothetical protein
MQGRSQADPIKVLLADDHTMFREGIARVLSDYGGLEPRDSGQSPPAARPSQHQRPVLVGGHGEADGLVDVAQPGGALVFGAELLALEFLPGLGPDPVGLQAVDAERVVGRALLGDRGMLAHDATAAH